MRINIDDFTSGKILSFEQYRNDEFLYNKDFNKKKYGDSYILYKKNDSTKFIYYDLVLAYKQVSHNDTLFIIIDEFEHGVKMVFVDTYVGLKDDYVKTLEVTDLQKDTFKLQCMLDFYKKKDFNITILNNETFLDKEVLGNISINKLSKSAKSQIRKQLKPIGLKDKHKIFIPAVIIILPMIFIYNIYNSNLEDFAKKQEVQLQQKQVVYENLDKKIIKIKSSGLYNYGKKLTRVRGLAK